VRTKFGGLPTAAQRARGARATCQAAGFRTKRRTFEIVRAETGDVSKLISDPEANV
jgi:hypothetical protein